MAQTLDREKEQVEALFQRVETVEEVAEAIEASQPREATKLRSVAEDALNSAQPVRIAIAAKLLALSDRTIRTWVDEGVLALVAEHPKRVDPGRLHQVFHLVSELRAAGRKRDLLDAVWYRMQDDELLGRADLAESLRQLRRGELVPALTKDEESALQHQ